jgi:hypothetical protein
VFFFDSLEQVENERRWLCWEGVEKFEKDFNVVFALFADGRIRRRRFGIEALAEMGEAEELEEVLSALGRVLSGIAGKVREDIGRGGGEVEIAALIESLAQGEEGVAERRFAEPFSEDGGRRPKLRWWAEGMVAESAEKNSLGAGCVLDVGHKYLPFRWLWRFWVECRREKAPPKRPLFNPIFTPKSPRLRHEKIGRQREGIVPYFYLTCKKVAREVFEELGGW